MSDQQNHETPEKNQEVVPKTDNTYLLNEFDKNKREQYVKQLQMKSLVKPVLFMRKDKNYEKQFNADTVKHNQEIVNHRYNLNKIQKTSGFLKDKDNNLKYINMNNQGGSRKNRMWKETQMKILKENLRMLTNIKNIKLRPSKSVETLNNHELKKGNAYYSQSKRAMEIDRENMKLMNSIHHAKPSLGNHIVSEPVIKVSNYEKEVLDINNSFLNKNAITQQQLEQNSQLHEVREEEVEEHVEQDDQEKVKGELKRKSGPVTEHKKKN